MGSESCGECQVVKAGETEHGLVNAVSLKLAVPKDLPVLQSGQSVFDSCSRPAVDGVLCFLLRAESASGLVVCGAG
jgi:hypothetical protein